VEVAWLLRVLGAAGIYRGARSGTGRGGLALADFGDGLLNERRPHTRLRERRKRASGRSLMTVRCYASGSGRNDP
jgi:hypothetical protein